MKTKTIADVEVGDTIISAQTTSHYLVVGVTCGIVILANKKLDNSPVISMFLSTLIKKDWSVELPLSNELSGYKILLEVAGFRVTR